MTSCRDFSFFIHFAKDRFSHSFFNDEAAAETSTLP
jgi:hypothetical protein